MQPMSDTLIVPFWRCARRVHVLMRHEDTHLAIPFLCVCACVRVWVSGCAPLNDNIVAPESHFARLDTRSEIVRPEDSNTLAGRNVVHEKLAIDTPTNGSVSDGRRVRKNSKNGHEICCENKYFTNEM